LERGIERGSRQGGESRIKKKRGKKTRTTNPFLAREVARKKKKDIYKDRR